MSAEDCTAHQDSRTPQSVALPRAPKQSCRSEGKSLRDMDRINKQTQERLQSIARANEVADMLQTIGSVLSFGSRIAMASQSFGTNTPAEITNAKSSKELTEAVGAARLQLMRDVEMLQRLYKRKCRYICADQGKGCSYVEKSRSSNSATTRTSACGTCGRTSGEAWTGPVKSGEVLPQD